MTYAPNLAGKTLSEIEKEKLHRNPYSGVIQDSWGRPVQPSMFGGSVYTQSNGSTVEEKKKS